MDLYIDKSIGIITAIGKRDGTSQRWHRDGNLMIIQTVANVNFSELYIFKAYEKCDKCHGYFLLKRDFSKV